MSNIIDTMDKICAVIDTQGFAFKDRFIAREIAIVSEYLTLCQELNPQIYWKNLIEEDQAIVLYSTQRIHGLHFCPFNPREHAFLPNSNKINELIEIWYNLVKSPEKPVVAFKNTHLRNIFIELEIPFIDLDDKCNNFPSIKQLQDKYGDNYLCAYHKKPNPNSNLRLNCAYRKANQIFRELNEINNPNSMEELI